MAASIFEGLGGGGREAITEPRRIFASLPNRDEQFDFPRDVQSEVWEKWHRRRDETDLVIKMNTGSGKTVVGLVLLQSCLNEDRGPAVYLVPDHVLRLQVMATAARLGLPVTDDEDDPAFRQGEAILVTVAAKLFNGQSRFGVLGSYRPTIELGSILVDDAHSTIAMVESQFSLRVPNWSPAYDELFALFAEDLRAQSVSGTAEIAERDGSAVVGVPYWVWRAKQDRARAILTTIVREEPHVFKWPLIKENLDLCEVAFSPGEVEIKLPYPNLTMLPSFAQARRRIYMTATLAADTSLVTSMGADSESVRHPVVPDTAGDLGDRIILTPLENNRMLTADRLREIVADKARTMNVVVIVPSSKKAALWRPYTNEIHDKDSASDCVARLTSGLVGLVVLIAKYDGVDLPGAACRILVIDGVPEFYSPLERREALVLQDSPAMKARQLQRIEQGMGRGVRGTNDYCAVILMDPRLVERLYRDRDIDMLSPGTAAQMRLSRQVNRRLRGQPETELISALDMFLARDTAWTTPSKQAVDGLVYAEETEISPEGSAASVAFGLALDRRFDAAVAALQDVINASTDARERGWLRERAATYLERVEPVQARQAQARALIDNAFLYRVEAVPYQRITPVGQQADSSLAHLRGNFTDGDTLMIRVESLLMDLEPDPTPGTYKAFERALRDVGLLLGFAAETPDLSDGVGPDGLWLAPDASYWVIECKSETEADSIIQRYAAQLGQSMDWFVENYPPPTFSAVPVLIHKSNRLDGTASIRAGSKIVTFERLAALREAVQGFASAIARSWGNLDRGVVRDNLTHFGLNAGTFLDRWSVDATR